MQYLIDPEAPPIESNVTAPGLVTWGRGRGCGFFNKPATAWPSQYTCNQHQEPGCTPDHYMSAVCIVQVRSWPRGLSARLLSPATPPFLLCYVVDLDVRGLDGLRVVCEHGLLSADVHRHEPSARRRPARHHPVYAVLQVERGRRHR